MGDKTATGHKIRLKRFERDIGDKALDLFGVRECADFLRTVPESPRKRQQYRLLMIWIFACARQEGRVDGNPVEATRKSAAPRQRERLTLHQFSVIRSAALPWLQNAMDLSPVTLRRREDICGLCFADLLNEALRAVPGKTEGSTGALLKIRVVAELQAVLDRRSDDVVSPYHVASAAGARPAAGNCVRSAGSITRRCYPSSSPMHLRTRATTQSCKRRMKTHRCSTRSAAWVANSIGMRDGS